MRPPASLSCTCHHVPIPPQCYQTPNHNSSPPPPPPTTSPTSPPTHRPHQPPRTHEPQQELYFYTETLQTPLRQNHKGPERTAVETQKWRRRTPRRPPRRRRRSPSPRRRSRLPSARTTSLRISLLRVCPFPYPRRLYSSTLHTPFPSVPALPSNPPLVSLRRHHSSSYPHPHPTPHPTKPGKPSEANREKDWTQEDTEAAGGANTKHLWEESWDDDDTTDDFSAQLKEELKKVEAAKKR